MEGVDSLYTETPEEPNAEEQQPFQLATVASVEEDGLTLTLDGAEEPTEKHYKCNTAVKFAAGQRVAVLELSGSKVVMFAVGNPGADAAAGIPPGGSAGQVLKKASDEDYAFTWGGIAGLLPSGGTDGQVLLKNGSTNYAVKWGSISGVLPSGGTAGQVLKKSSAVDYACTWGSIDGTLPSGGTDGQVLLKSGSTAYAAKWGTISPTVAALTSGSYKLTLSGTTLTPSGTGFTIGTSSYPVTVRASSVVLYYSTYNYCTLTCTSAKKLAVNGTAIS